MGEITGVKAIINFFLKWVCALNFVFGTLAVKCLSFPTSSNLSVLQGPPTPNWDS